ncbi:MAG TPA: PAS domain S-box protein [Nitrospira sp.]|nr:PAS domain S-box protein [Nitrospira sp.]
MTQQSILIVDDDAVVADDLAQKVKALGYRVLDIASTGEAALRISHAHTPDLILLDITLAGKLDGVETATRIKEFSDIPLVFLTAHSDPMTVQKATAAGSLGYILKPFRERDVEVQIRAALYASERKRTEQKLQRTEELLLRAQRGAQAGVWEIDLRTDRVTWSEPYYDLFGIDHSTEPSVAAWISCIHPEDRERVKEDYRQSIKEKRNQNMEFRIIKPDGEIRWIHRQGQVEVDEQGNAIRIQGISFDITDRKQADEVIKAIALFPAQNPSPVLRVSEAGILLYMNQVSHQLLQDLNLRVGQPVPIFLENLVGNALKATESQQAEYSLGSRHYLITVTPVAEGNYANFYWTDITKLKRAEEALRESEQRLTGLVTTAMDAIVSVDGNQRITLFNQAAEHMFGCPADQAIGHTLDRFIPDRYQQAHRDHVANFGRTGTTTRRMGKYGTVYGLRATGEEFPLEASISHLEVGGHKVFTVILRDITQRVQSEQALRESEEWMRQFAGQLEQRVAERTGELLQSESRLRALATELNLAEQRERTRLATDLHDYLAQLLVLGRLTLGQAKRFELPSRAEKLIKETEETLGKALNYCRTLMAELSPPVLQEQGLAAGLIWLGEHMKRQDLEVSVNVDHADCVMLPEDRAVLLFQSVRELLIDVAKHGAIKKAQVTMSHRDGLLTVVVRDDNGFDLAAVSAAARISPLSSKFGLFSIRERMKALGGTFEITSSPGHGTTATLTLPLPMPTIPPSQN